MCVCVHVCAHIYVCSGRSSLRCEGRGWSRSRYCHSSQGFSLWQCIYCLCCDGNVDFSAIKLSDKLRCGQCSIPISLSTRGWWGKGESKGGRERHCPQTELFCSMLSWGFQVNGCTVGASSQDVDDILLQEGRPVHKSGVEAKNRFVRPVAEPGGS